MSYILDALKKLEREKERKSRSGGMLNISGELFATNGFSRPKKRNWPVILLLILLASLLTFSATFFLLGDAKWSRQPATAKRLVPTPAPQSVIPAPVTLTAGQSTSVAPVVSQPQTAIPAVAPLVSKELTKPIVAQKLATTPPDVTKQSARAPKTVASSASVSLSPAPADIKVSGIAWQDNQHASRAVVNGFLVMVGDTVAGARISAIYQDKVRFSGSNGNFDVELLSSGLPAAPK